MSLRVLGLSLCLLACAPRYEPVPRPPATVALTPGLRTGDWLLSGQPLPFVVPVGQTLTLRVINAAAGDRTIHWETDANADPIPPTPEPATPAPQAAPFGFWGTGRPSRTVLEARSAVVPAADEAGATFWINNGNGQLSGDRACVAYRRHVTPHAYFYVDEQEARLDDAAVERMAEAFEQRIRPGITAVFGAEAQPGLDGDARLFVVISPWVGSASGHEGMMGYFWYRDAIPPVDDPAHLAFHSNGKEVLFLSSRLVDERAVTAFGTLAHEYQHLIGFTRKRLATGVDQPEVPWLDEGLSMLAMDLAGYGAVGGDPFVVQDIEAYRQQPAAYSLIDWAQNPGGYGYGLSYLFVRHLVERYGLGVVGEVVREPGLGQAGLERVLRRHGTDLETSFVNWAIASQNDLQALPLGVGEATGKLTLKPWSQMAVSVSATRQARRLVVGTEGLPVRLSVVRTQ